jgi:hypothetical protein
LTDEGHVVETPPDRNKLWADLLQDRDPSLALQPKLLDLARVFATAEWANDLYPWKSHHCLGISRSWSYAESTRLPAVWFHFDSARSEYLITYQPTFGSGPTTEEWAQAVVDEVRERILKWLNRGETSW